MKLGAEPKKLVILLVLVALAAYLVYTNLISGAPAASPVQPRAAATPSPATPTETGRPVVRAEAPRARQSRLQEFRPSLRRRAMDLSAANELEATLRLDLLDKLQKVSIEGGRRSLFDFGAAPLPKQPEPKIVPKPQTVEPPPAPEPPPTKPRTPQIPLRFYGFTAPLPQGPKRAFFLDGDEILVGGEGDILKMRYRVVRIGVNSVVVEDLQSNSEQTLPLEPQVG
ncbi:MAG: hypothetical protein ACUVXB_12840 [Bryobacteraceae bacterium]